MNLNLSMGQWLNVAMFAVGSLAMAGWWKDFLTPEVAGAVTGGLVWVSGIMNFVLTGKAVDTPAAPAAPAAPAK